MELYEAETDDTKKNPVYCWEQIVKRFPPQIQCTLCRTLLHNPPNMAFEVTAMGDAVRVIAKDILHEPDNGDCDDAVDLVMDDNFTLMDMLKLDEYGDPIDRMQY